MENLKLFKIRTEGSYGNRQSRRRTQKFRCKDRAVAEEYADNLRIYWGQKIIWIKEVKD